MGVTLATWRCGHIVSDSLRSPYGAADEPCPYCQLRSMSKAGWSLLAKLYDVEYGDKEIRGGSQEALLLLQLLNEYRDSRFS